MTTDPTSNALERPTETVSAPVQVAQQDGGATTTLRPLPEDAVPIVPMRNLVLFPGMILPAGVGRERSIIAAQEAVRTERPIGLLLQRDSSQENPGPQDLYWVGTVANIVRYVTAPDGSHHLVCQGEQRFRVLEFLEGWPFLVARILRISESEEESKEIEARMLQLRARAAEILELLPQVPAELANTVQSITSAPRLADLIAGFMDLKPDEKQELLETFDAAARIDKVLKRLAHRIEVLQLSNRINEQTR
ncbi:MAG: LON peptidase substrate-binding domain-containing protein, partial [Burkholderiales bacterium]